MSKVGDSIFDLLNGDTNITDVIGLDNVFPVVCIKENTPQFVLYSLISGNPENDNDDFATSNSFVYRISLVLKDYDVLQTMRNDLLLLLNNNDQINSGNDLRIIRYITEADDYSVDLQRFMRHIDFEFSVNE